MTEKLRPFLLAALCLGLAGLVWLDNRPEPQPAAPPSAAAAAEAQTDSASDAETSADTETRTAAATDDTKPDTETEPEATTAALANDDASQESGGDADAADAPVVETGTAVPAGENDNAEPRPADAATAAPSESAAAEVPVEGGAVTAPDDDSVANPLSSLTLDMLDQTVQRPLFAPARKRPPPAEAGASEAPAKMDNAYDLLGVALGGNRPIAIMRKKQDGKSFRVEVGDMLGGWHVSKVDSQSVELEKAGGEQEIVPLFRE